MGSPFRPGSWCFVLALGGFVGACGGESPPLFPQSVDIPVAPAQAEPRIQSPSEAQPSSPPETSPAAVAPAAPAALEKPEPPEAPAQPPPPVAEAVEARPQAEPLDVPADITELVDAMDRYDSDRDLDANRHPGELLAFLGLAPGMHVAELFAGKGYTTELIARRVGSSGKVWAENPPALLKFVGKQFAERMDKPVMANVVRIDQPADASLPAAAKNLDAVVSVLSYHDAVWLGVDRDAMNKAVFEALKKGGEYVVVDHSAATGHGVHDVKTLHRIEESTVVREVLSVGFQKSGSAAFLRNPADNRDWNDSPGAAGERRGTSDRFVLKFVRP